MTLPIALELDVFALQNAMLMKDLLTGSAEYSLKLTELQRESLVAEAPLDKKLREQLVLAGKRTHYFRMNHTQLDHLYHAIYQVMETATQPHYRRLAAILANASDLLNGVTDRIFQFKITLKHIEPPIWRRIQVPDCCLNDFHQFIQAAFGWENYHLHEFNIGGVNYSEQVDGADFGDYAHDDEVLLSDLLPETAKRTKQTKWTYVYDLGDSWEHEVAFERCPPKEPKGKCPICVDGARACPLEDSGGPMSYDNLIEAITDPENERHEWLGNFDPEAFNVSKATREMRKV